MIMNIPPDWREPILWKSGAIVDTNYGLTDQDDSGDGVAEEVHKTGFRKNGLTVNANTITCHTTGVCWKMWSLQYIGII